MDEIERIQRSKTLSMWLRHKPERGGLTLSKEGWAAVPAILEAFERIEQPMTRPELIEVIKLDPKGRFEIEGERVRARYGHSLELEEKPHPGMPPATLFHGTSRRFLPKLLELGLRPMKRQYVHLSPDKATAKQVGMRRDQQPAIVVVAAHDAHHAGIQFYPRGKGIWLSDPIPPQYLSVLEETPPPPPKAAPPNRPTDGRAAAYPRTAQPRPPRSASQAARQAAPGTPRRRRPKGGFTKPQNS
jgi:putative RNA 2'-phosphotransferase